MKKESIPFLISISSGVLYGILLRILFFTKIPSPTTSHLFGLMTFGFIFIVPLVIGTTTVFFSSPSKQKSILYSIFFPWISIGILLFFAMVIGWEGAICLFIISPIFLILSSIGGVISCIIFRTRSGSANKKLIFVSFLILPIIWTPVENQFTPPYEVRTVQTEAIFSSSPEKIWKEIAEVRLIEPNEQPSSLFIKMGFPRPLEATLSYYGVGGVRKAKFEKGLQFNEKITEWIPLQKIAFTIEADTSRVSPTALDEHVTVGGEHFDVTYGEFLLEPINTQKTRLILKSHHRVSTHFNFYSRLWTDWIIQDVQSHLVKIIQKRVEKS